MKASRRVFCVRQDGEPGPVACSRKWRRRHSRRIQHPSGGGRSREEARPGSRPVTAAGPQRRREPWITKPCMRKIRWSRNSRNSAFSGTGDSPEAHEEEISTSVFQRQQSNAAWSTGLARTGCSRIASGEHAALHRRPPGVASDASEQLSRCRAAPAHPAFRIALISAPLPILLRPGISSTCARW
jgi:hypothetical protein